jgi:hypothetical protein
MILINIRRCFQDIRLFTAVTGMTSAEFTALLPAFGAAGGQAKTGTLRQRQEGGGRTHTVVTGREKLFFIVCSVNCDATCAVLAWLVAGDRAQPPRGVTTDLPVWEAAWGPNAVLPERKIARVEELLGRFPQVNEGFGEGTERPIRWPTAKARQQPSSSGKKKGPRVKHLVVTAPTKPMLVLSDPFPGHTPDKTGANEQAIFAPIPKEVRGHFDLGFLGIPNERPEGTVSMLDKKPKGRPRADDAQTRNREQARCRVLVAHALGGENASEPSRTGCGMHGRCLPTAWYWSLVGYGMCMGRWLPTFQSTDQNCLHERWLPYFATTLLYGGSLIALIRVWLPIIYDGFELFGKEIKPPEWLENDPLMGWVKAFLFGVGIFAATSWLGYLFGLTPAVMWRHIVYCFGEVTLWIVKTALLTTPR